MKEVVRKEVLKWLDVGVINPISDSSWVSLVQVVKKNGRTTVIQTESNVLLPSRTVTDWRIFIDYRKINKATRKDHFLLPFLDLMLDQLAGHEYYCFLYGYSGYNQITKSLENQEKTTFTCPYGTFSFQRMLFGLCNALSTFQRYMMATFSQTWSREQLKYLLVTCSSPVAYTLSLYVYIHEAFIILSCYLNSSLT